jgi:hypothetical protein
MIRCRKKREHPVTVAAGYPTLENRVLSVFLQGATPKTERGGEVKPSPVTHDFKKAKDISLNMPNTLPLVVVTLYYTIFIHAKMPDTMQKCLILSKNT